MATTTPGTYRSEDLSPVDLAEAQAAWTPLAREVLIRVAGEYQAVVTYGELAEELQQGTIERVLAKSDLERGIEALLRGMNRR